MSKGKITIKFKVQINSEKFIEKCLISFKRIQIYKNQDIYTLIGTFTGRRSSYDFFREFSELNIDLHCQVKNIIDKIELQGYIEEFHIKNGELIIEEFKHIHIDKLKELFNLKKNFWISFDKILNNNKIDINNTNKIFELCTNYLWEIGYYQEILQKGVSSIIFEYIIQLNKISDKLTNIFDKSILNNYFNKNIEEIIKKKVIDFPY